MKQLHTLLRDKRFIVCVGSGGVGKTTLSCLLGLLAGQAGKKTLVVTIDPAKRLADALGLTIGNAPQLIDLKIDGFNPPPGGQVFAMMLDLQAAWDNLVHRLSQTDKMRDQVLNNRFYHYLSRQLAGSQEFVACEALYTLAEEYDFDTIILDTPPTAHALDFLDAPQKILGFLDQEAFHFFLHSKNSLTGKLSMGFLGGASALIHALMERFTGKTFIEEFVEFLRALTELYPPIIKRTKAFQQLLKSSDTSFVIVAAARENSLAEALLFHKEIARRHYNLGLIICNKVTYQIKPTITLKNIEDMVEELHKQAEPWPLDLAQRLQRMVSEYHQAIKYEAQLLKTIKSHCQPVPVVAVPRLTQAPAETHALSELFRLLS